MYGAAVEVLSIDFCRFCPVRAEPAAVISPPFLAVLLRFQRLSRAFHYLSFCRFCPACAEPVGTEPLSAPAHCSCRPPLCSALLSSLPLLAAAILPLSSPPLICLSPHPCPPLQPFPTAAPLRPHGRAGTGGLRRGLLKRHDLSLPLRGIRATGCALSARRGGSADSVGPVVRSRTLLNTPHISTDSFFKREVCWYRSTHRPGVLFGLDTQVAPRRTPHRPTQPDALRAVCATASSAAYPTAPSRAVGHRQIELWPAAAPTARSNGSGVVSRAVDRPRLGSAIEGQPGRGRPGASGVEAPGRAARAAGGSDGGASGRRGRAGWRGRRRRLGRAGWFRQRLRGCALH